MLIAGADPAVTKADLARRLGGQARLLRCCVDLGSELVDTRSNAEEAGRWLARHKYRSCVWSPATGTCAARATNSANTLANTYTLIDAVRTRPGFVTLFGEYNKYVLRRLARVGRPVMSYGRAPLGRCLSCSSIPPRSFYVRRDCLFACLFGKRPVRPWSAAGPSSTIGSSRMCSASDSRSIGAIPDRSLPHRGQASGDGRDDRNVRLTETPVVVMKRELVDIPLSAR